MSENQSTTELQWEDTDDNWSVPMSTDPVNSIINSTDEETFDDPKIDPITNQHIDGHLTFVSEVEEFNKKFNKSNSYTPNIPNQKDWMFVYDFILEELEEYKEACERNDIIGVLDALCDITYVSLGNGTMLHGLKSKIWPAYLEIQRSNMSKACATPQEAIDTLKYAKEKFGEECHVEKVNDMYIVYRTRDRKVMKNVNYSSPNLEQFFSTEEINNARSVEMNQKKFFDEELTQLKNPEDIIKSSNLRENLPDQSPLNENNFNTTETDTEDYW